MGGWVGRWVGGWVGRWVSGVVERSGSRVFYVTSTGPSKFGVFDSTLWRLGTDTDMHGFAMICVGMQVLTNRNI